MGVCLFWSYICFEQCGATFKWAKWAIIFFFWKRNSEQRYLNICFVLLSQIFLILISSSLFLCFSLPSYINGFYPCNMVGGRKRRGGKERDIGQDGRTGREEGREERKEGGVYRFFSQRFWFSRFELDCTVKLYL